eukprot:11663881-Ditylum_brightwellii.AAC.1
MSFDLNENAPLLDPLCAPSSSSSNTSPSPAFGTPPSQLSLIDRNDADNDNVKEEKLFYCGSH